MAAAPSAAAVAPWVLVLVLVVAVVVLAVVRGVWLAVPAAVLSLPSMAVQRTSLMTSVASSGLSVVRGAVLG